MTPPPDGLARPFLHAGTGSGTELILVRHAEVHADWQGKAYGDLDVPLSAEGEERTREVAEMLAALGPARVLASPLSRARVLGEAVAGAAGLALEELAELREVHRGAWQGRRVADLVREAPKEVEAFYADPWTWRGHGGESDELLSTRAWSAVDELLAPDAGRLVLVSHYNVIRVLVAGALGIPAPASFAVRVDPGRVTALADEPDGWHLVYSNVLDPTTTVDPVA